MNSLPQRPHQSGTELDDAELADRAVELAGQLLRSSLADQTRSERRRSRRLGRLLSSSGGRELLFTLTDQVLRIEAPAHGASRLRAIVRSADHAALGPIDRHLLRMGSVLGASLPRVVMPLVKRRVQAEARGVVLPAEDPAFARHLARRRSEGQRVNINLLGEAILSQEEADTRFRRLLDRVARPDVDVVSVKISAIVANLDATAFDDTLDRVTARLRALYRAADAARPVTFVNLDMEEYRDLELTLQSFMRVLDELEFEGTEAGIVFQAYLPDSHDALARLGSWSAQRHARTGTPTKVRLVKGANLAMELVEAELHGWTPAPYPTKAEVDASYKALLDSALRPEWSSSLRIGVASHNLFDVAWAMVCSERAVHAGRRPSSLEFEMLEGMAPAQARAVARAAGGLLLYTPVVTRRDFTASIAYLTRRLDENTQPENFLSHLFDLRPGTPAFHQQAERFRTSVADRHRVDTRRRRGVPERPKRGFLNQPDLDFTDALVRQATNQAIQVAESTEVTLSWVTEVSRVDEIVATATLAFGASEVAPPAIRRSWLLAVADLMESERAATNAALVVRAGKAVREADPEVSEAVDFCRYYAIDGLDETQRAQSAGLTVHGRGVVLVAGPWNFPYAIPVGGVAGAIAAGNSVVLKPSPDSAAIGAHIVDQFHRAGVPREVVQLVVCLDNEVGRHLVTHDEIDTLILTGSYETAGLFTRWRPQRRVLAETSGKNAIVVTASADLDLAIADIVRSAFGHSGQKCSAASLAIVESTVFDDPSFRERLRAAVLSLPVGPSTTPGAVVTPLVVPAGPELTRALTQLEVGEAWLVPPVRVDSTANLWSPGVRWGVQSGSWFHLTECFGPVLGVMRARDLDDAIGLQNATPYGLTGGIHSLDEAEIRRWEERVEVGNAYVNRSTTGAIVRRQPFGGWKHSSVGGGAKAGGPAYVAQLQRIVDPDPNVDEAARSFRAVWDNEFSVDQDPTELAAERNVYRRRALHAVALRHAEGHPREVALAALAADTVGARLLCSSTSDESDSDFARRAAMEGIARVRSLTDLDVEALTVLYAAGIPVDRDPIVSDGRTELRHWTIEQTVSRTVHRHGRLAGDAAE